MRGDILLLRSLDRFLERLLGLVVALEGGQRLAAERVRGGAVGLALEDLLGLREHLFVVARDQRELRIADARVGVVGIETHRLVELPVRLLELLQCGVRTRQRVVRRRMVRIELQDVAVLDHRLVERLRLDGLIAPLHERGDLLLVGLAADCE
jgi:hypothetical protein